MQVENESGLLGSVRDYTRESNALFNGPVPEKLVTALKKKPDVTEVFGADADEAFTVYYLSAISVKWRTPASRSTRCQTYVNCWNGGHDTADQWDSYDRPGETYPSGGSGLAQCWIYGRRRLPISTSSLRTPPSSRRKTSA